MLADAVSLVVNKNAFVGMGANESIVHIKIVFPAVFCFEGYFLGVDFGV